MRKVLLMGSKGGVGTTVSAINIAAETAKMNKRVLLFDASNNNGITAQLDLSKRDLKTTEIEKTDKIHHNIIQNLDILSNNESVQINTLHAILSGKKFTQQYDYIFVDASPFSGQYSEFLLDLCNELIIPVKSEPLGYRSLLQYLKILHDLKKRISIVLKGILLIESCEEDDFANNIAEHFAKYVIQHKIPYEPFTDIAMLENEIVVEKLRGNPIQEQYAAIVKELYITH